MAAGGSPTKAQESVKLLDDMILTPMMYENPDLYWKWRRADHEHYNGSHYDEAFAIWEVEQMHHTDANGKKYSGAHWDLSEVQAVYMKYKVQLKPADNVYDMYVALNSFFHDNCVIYKSWFQEAFEARLIEGAISYFFKDEDAPEGKIWKYYQAMRK